MRRLATRVMCEVVNVLLVMQKACGVEAQALKTMDIGCPGKRCFKSMGWVRWALHPFSRQSCLNPTASACVNHASAIEFRDLGELEANATRGFHGALYGIAQKYD
jgi:hypothetical protein